MSKIKFTHEMINEKVKAAMTPKPMAQPPVNPALDVLKQKMQEAGNGNQEPV